MSRSGAQQSPNPWISVGDFARARTSSKYLHEYRGRRMPCHEALELLLPALEALHEIHERGYVHRDIKTGNIIVTRSPGRPATAIVIDLGLIKPDRALRNAASPPTTEVGRMLCTPGYTSPEQAAGKPVDRRSDVYSMAVTLYRVLAGRLPFKEARGQPLALLARHIYNIPTMLAEAAGTARVPDAVAVVIERALSKDPARRPQTMMAFADELRAAGPPMSAPTARLRRARDITLGFGVAVMLGWFMRPPTTCPPAVACTDVPVLEFAAPSSPVVIPAVAQPAPHVDESATGDAARRPPDERDGSAGSVRRGARPRTAAYVRALAGRTAQVRACAGVAGGALAAPGARGRPGAAGRGGLDPAATLDPAAAQPVLAMALGAGETTPFKLTAAYTAFVNGGRTAFLSVPMIDGLLEGGVPILKDGQCLGAVGVSGVKASEDAQIARAGIGALGL